MNTLEFISDIVENLAWPVLVLSFIFVLRKQIGDLLASLTHLKFKDLELDFRRLAQSAKKLPPPPLALRDGPPSDRVIYSSLEGQILDVAGHAPSVAVLLAWAGVETALSAAVARLAVSPEPPSLRSPSHNVEQLRNHSNLPHEVKDTINEMRMLRNKIIHNGKHLLRISRDSALSYSETAIRIIEHLNGLKR